MGGNRGRLLLWTFWLCMDHEGLKIRSPRQLFPL